MASYGTVPVAQLPVARRVSLRSAIGVATAVVAATALLLIVTQPVCFLVVLKSLVHSGGTAAAGCAAGCRRDAPAGGNRLFICYLMPALSMSVCLAARCHSVACAWVSAPAVRCAAAAAARRHARVSRELLLIFLANTRSLSLKMSICNVLHACVFCSVTDSAVNSGQHQQRRRLGCAGECDPRGTWRCPSHRICRCPPGELNYLCSFPLGFRLKEHTDDGVPSIAASRLHIDPELPFEGSSAYEGKDDAVRRRSAGLKQQRVQSLVRVVGSQVVIRTRRAPSSFECTLFGFLLQIFASTGANVRFSL